MDSPGQVLPRRAQYQYFPVTLDESFRRALSVIRKFVKKKQRVSRGENVCRRHEALRRKARCGPGGCSLEVGALCHGQLALGLA